MPALQPGNICIIDIVGVFVRVSGPTETDRSRQTHRDKLTETDRPRQTDAHTIRAGGFEREAL